MYLFTRKRNFIELHFVGHTKSICRETQGLVSGCNASRARDHIGSYLVRERGDRFEELKPGQFLAENAYDDEHTEHVTAATRAFAISPSS